MEIQACENEINANASTIGDLVKPSSSFDQAIVLSYDELHVKYQNLSEQHFRLKRLTMKLLTVMSLLNDMPEDKMDCVARLLVDEQKHFEETALEQAKREQNELVEYSKCEEEALRSEISSLSSSVAGLKETAEKSQHAIALSDSESNKLRANLFIERERAKRCSLDNRYILAQLAAQLTGQLK